MKTLVMIALAFIAASSAAAQTYPSRPVTMVVPFAPGGPTDTIARILAEPMRGFLGQPVIVENVSGAGGSIGVGRVEKHREAAAIPTRRLHVERPPRDCKVVARRSTRRGIKPAGHK